MNCQEKYTENIIDRIRERRHSSKCVIQFGLHIHSSTDFFSCYSHVNTQNLPRV